MVKRRYLPLAAIFAGLGVLSHPYVLVFLAGGLVFFLLSQGKSGIQRVKSLANMLGLIIITVSPWILWSSFMFGTFPSALLARYVEGSTNLSLALWTRIIVLYRTITPYLFAYSVPEASSIPAPLPTVMAQVQSHPILAIFALTYIFTFPGALTFSLTVFSCLGFARLFRSMRQFFISLVAIPMVLVLAITGVVTSGLTPYFLHPIVVVLVALGVWQLLQTGRTIRWLAAVGMVLESLFFAWVIIYPFYLAFQGWVLVDYVLVGLILVCYLVTIAFIGSIIRDDAPTQALP